MESERRRPFSRRNLGWGLVLLGLMANRPFLEPLSPDSAIESDRVRGAIVVLQATVLILGLGVLRAWDRKLRRLSGMWSQLGVFLATVVGSVMLSEALVRLIQGPVAAWAPPPLYVGEKATRPSPTFVADATLGWRMRPDISFGWSIDGRETTYRASREGFRSPYSTSELEGDEWVAAIGDSFTFGTGVPADSTFPARLDRALPGVPVHNLGLPGFGIDQMWMTVRHVALPSRPRAVIVAFIDHDWDRTLTAYRTAEGMAKPTFVLSSGMQLGRAGPSDRPWRLVVWLERNSALWALMRASARGLGHYVPVGRWWSLNSAILYQIARDVEEAGTDVVFVRLPIRGAVPFPQLARWMEENGLSYIDLASEHPPDIHLPTDDHMNDRGHAFVAQAIAPLLRQMLER